MLVWHWGREEARYTFELFRALRAVPHLNVVLSCSRTSNLHNTARELEGAVIEPIITFFGSKQTWRGKLAGWAALTTIPFTMVHFQRLLRKHRIDVAICAQNSIWDIATIPTLRRSSVRYLQVLHELHSHPGEAHRLRVLLPLWQATHADGVVVLSEQIKQQIVAHCPPDRVWKLAHGAMTYGAQQVEPAVHPRGARPLRLLFFGRINRYKGLDRLLAALPFLRARGLPFKLVIAGAGDLTAHREQLKAPDIEVHNHWLDNNELVSLLLDSDLVVLPYSLSSQSGVAATAYTVGRPVVATPVGGLIEQVLPTTGVLAQDMTASALADAIGSMICDPALFDRCASGALHHAQTELDWHRETQVLSEIIHAVHMRPRRGSSVVR